MGKPAEPPSHRGELPWYQKLLDDYDLGDPRVLLGGGKPGEVSIAAFSPFDAYNGCSRTSSVADLVVSASARLLVSCFERERSASYFATSS